MSAWKIVNHGRNALRQSEACRFKPYFIACLAVSLSQPLPLPLPLSLSLPLLLPQRQRQHQLPFPPPPWLLDCMW